MSRYDAQKELNTVYRRCLSSLHLDSKFRLPSPEKCRKFETRVAKEVAEKSFERSEERDRWILNRYGELYYTEMARLFKDPLESAKAQIKGKMGMPF